MSQHQDIISRSIARDRPRRQQKQSLKAAELIDAGEPVPGISNNSTLGPPTTVPSTTPLLKTEVVKTEFSDAGEMIKDLPPYANDTTFTSFATRMTPNTARPAMLHRAVNNASGRHGPVTCNDASISVPDFSPKTFVIYWWDSPLPRNYLDLSPSRLAWKQRTDLKEKAQDINDGSDHWEDFSGVRDDYRKCNDHRRGCEMEYAIATCFKTRAKRAFWAGKTWQGFEIEERRIDSAEKAKAESDPEQRALLLKNALDNRLRLAVFDAIKERLCEEIWLEKHEDPPGLVKLELPKREDSQAPKAESARSTPFDPRRPRARSAANTQELERGVTGYSKDGYGTWQPLYRGEMEPPAGMRTFMKEMRQQQREEATESELGADHVHDKLPNVASHANGLASAQNGAEVEFERPLDFADSDEGEDK